VIAIVPVLTGYPETELWRVETMYFREHLYLVGRCALLSAPVAQQLA
jgi:hypothetical protein